MSTITIPLPMPTSTTSGSSPDRPSRPIVLVVDDELDLVEMITLNLERNGFAVLAATDGRRALELAQKHRPALILLDVMLPGMEGTEVARRLRAERATDQIPIIMLTARTEETDVVVGLTLGADDYVTKPFSMKVLMARVKAMLRRGRPPAEPQDENGLLRAGPLVMDTNRHETTVDGHAVKLTLTEFKLLRALVEARGRVLSRDRLMDKAMGEDVFVTDRAIDVHVTSIRKKLGDAAWLVHTVRGVGYRLQEERED